jgi:hypothetical protein
MGGNKRSTISCKFLYLEKRFKNRCGEREDELTMLMTLEIIFLEQLHHVD